MRNLAANTPGLSIDRLEATRDRMNGGPPEAVVADYHPLIADLTLPDPDDRHVLAAAISARASVIVTWNLKDFPARDLLAHGVTSKSPDDFLTDLHAAGKLCHPGHARRRAAALRALFAAGQSSIGGADPQSGVGGRIV
ncbi:PIN domain-containing protein (plasmid) [Agrobacterium fabrum]|uniref:PIN domain-containing protein n=1 Tax=Agrobacterium fabrum (strain C58 / ATCC 33970) TaxID=176299 RepID=Q8UK24_AGRFC|nr:PIN domain-containing protein [Agrobacterium fabrum]AAL45988.1 hypothetical protein Atu5300 [Agrobacterium fabrum str. C58]MDH6297908.1 hypothetical protein [Agrobacterium fabrum]TRB27992.1 PIN domain-containing protein [Agrobacterium fabrum]WEN04006.1 PIN domain-containing protein [Agrobacterium fabrum]WER19740.1 PIN domain-containing protein [Agrobacterium fabrum]